MDLNKIDFKIRNSNLSDEDVLKYGKVLILEFAKQYHKKRLNIDDVILCDAPDEILPCIHKCFSLCQLRGHCNHQKDKA